MRKIVAALNITLDGNYDHTAGLPDEELHQHYTELLRQSDAILYGRITYQLMEFWRTVLENPSELQSMNEFAAAIDDIPKIVFSRSLTETDWKSAKLANRDLKNTVSELKKQHGKTVLVGSRSLIIELSRLGLIDEYQICIHPVIAGSGPLLFENIGKRIVLTLVRTKVLDSGAIILCYRPREL